MVDQLAAPPPVNPVISIRPLSTPTPGRDATNVQTELAVLPPGTTLEGFVINRDQTGNPILRTPIGDLQMQSDVFVKTGSQMVIRVDATSDTRARIISINGLPPADYAAQSARGLTQDTISPSQMFAPVAATPNAANPLPAGKMPLQQGGVPLQAMLLSPAAAGGIAAPLAATNPLFAAMPNNFVPPGLMKLQAGAALKVMLLELQLPTAIASPHTSDAAPASPQPMAQAPAAKTPANTNQPPLQESTMASPQAARVATASQEPSPATSAQPLPNAASAPVAIAAAYPPQATPQAQVPAQALFVPGIPVAPAKPAAANTQKPITTTAAPVSGIVGLVLGHEADGGNIVQTPFGILKIFSPMPLPIHTQLTLQVEPDAASPATPAFTPTNFPEDTGELSNLSRGWPQLADTLQQVNENDPPLARELAQSLPQVGHKLASGMMFFIAAVKNGDLKQWLGARALAALESSMPEAAAKLKGDMAQLQQLMLHSPLDQWKGVMIPMLHEGQLEYARLYLRDEPREEAGAASGSKGKEQRFIVDVELSQLGDMQFDGFVRPDTAKKQFDLMIRTVRPLDGAIANDIRGLFETALQTTGYQGYLGFQQGVQHFVRPLASTAASKRPDDHHTILA